VVSGDVVALVAPGGAVARERVKGAVRLLGSRGLRVQVRDDIDDRHRYLAGDDRRRARELVDALKDPEVKAVFLARGGYGTQRIVDELQPEALSQPRAVVGFSDNTVLLNWLRDQCGWAVVHGPHPREESPDEMDAVLGCLGYFGDPVRPATSDLKLWNPGAWGPVTAEVAGGCLSLLSTSAGTSYGFSGRRRIVFLEDTREPAYRVDRMLHHLTACGALEQTAAVVFGRPESFLAAGEDPGQLEHLLAEFASGASFPVLSGLACGHTKPNLPLPFGPRALLDPQKGTLVFLEGVVR
jgi:muramoyltetrapeptide carboxypeptidase